MIEKLLLAQSILSLLVWGQSCSLFEFETQPPLGLDCNPYDIIQNPPVWRLRIACEVIKKDDDIGQFDVHWIRKGPDNVITDLGRLRKFTDTTDEIEIQYGFHILNADFQDDMIGNFWCAVKNDTHYFGISNALTIFRPEEYDTELPLCMNIIRNNTVTCLDNPITSQHFPPGININTDHSTTTSYYTQSTAVIVAPSSTMMGTMSSSPIATFSNQPEEILGRARGGSSMNEITPSALSLTRPSVTGFAPSMSSNSANDATTASSGTLLMDYTLLPNNIPSTDTYNVLTADASLITSSTPTDDSLLPVIQSNTELILAGSIGGAMLLLIVLLLVIIFALLFGKNRKRSEICRDEPTDMQRMSSVRSSQRPLLNSCSSDLIPNTSYISSTSDAAIPSSGNGHHYSMIQDSFVPKVNSQPSYNPPMMPSGSLILTSDLTASQLSNDVMFGVPEYSEVGEAVTDSSLNETSYSSLKQDSQSALPLNDGYNKLRQQKPVPSAIPLEYSKLYTPDISQLVPETSDYNKLSHISNKPQCSPNKGGLVEPYGTCDIATPTIFAGQDKKPSTGVFDDPRYSTTRSVASSSASTDEAAGLKKSLVANRYQGDYERDPQYSIPLKKNLKK